MRGGVLTRFCLCRDWRYLSRASDVGICTLYITRAPTGALVRQLGCRVRWVGTRASEVGDEEACVQGVILASTGAVIVQVADVPARVVRKQLAAAVAAALVRTLAAADAVDLLVLPVVAAPVVQPGGAGHAAAADGGRVLAVTVAHAGGLQVATPAAGVHAHGGAVVVVGALLLAGHDGVGVDAPQRAAAAVVAGNDVVLLEHPP
mmetsp:Transcript_17370/g.44134  ORF Transcript_17370/g.44134 Transcript_17370/m.44134 type:complete len:205 (-) Transcript_17370:364-978(-)